MHLCVQSCVYICTHQCRSRVPICLLPTSPSTPLPLLSLYSLPLPISLSPSPLLSLSFSFFPSPILPIYRFLLPSLPLLPSFYLSDVYIWLTGQWASPVSPSTSPQEGSLYRYMQNSEFISVLYTGSLNLNTDPHVCTAQQEFPPTPTEPSPQPSGSIS